MSWYAVDAIDDALSATKRLLLPVESTLWLKLAVIVFFVGGAGGFPGGFNGSTSVPGEYQAPPSDVTGSLEPWIPLIIAIGVAVLLLGLTFAILSAIMQFALVDAVVSREVHVRRYVRNRAGKGLRLFGFQLGIGLVVIALAVAMFAPALLGGGSVGLALLVIAIPILFVVALFVWLVFLLTIDFIVPVMVERDLGVLPAWRAFWGTLRANLGQVAVYVVVRWVLGIAAAIAVGIAAALIAVVVGIVAIPLAIAVWALAGTGELLVILAIVLGIPLLLVYIALVAIVQVPVQSYLRYYALLVLSDLNPDFDLLGEFGDSVKSE